MEPSITYEIRVEEQLSDRWSDWFSGMEIRSESDGRTILFGQLSDQAALLGVLQQLQALNLTLVSVMQITMQK
jgi:hypothetical protein